MTVYPIQIKTGKLNIFQKIYWSFLIPLIYFGKLYLMVERGDNLLFQNHTDISRLGKVFLRLIQKKGIKLTTLIHNLNSLRAFGEIEQREIQAINLYDKIIVHNDCMKTYLIEKGIVDNKLVVLEIFDYLTDSIVTDIRRSRSAVNDCWKLSSSEKFVYIPNGRMQPRFTSQFIWCCFG